MWNVIKYKVKTLFKMHEFVLNRTTEEIQNFNISHKLNNKLLEILQQKFKHKRLKQH